MIQKRYQFFSKGGIKWTDWFDLRNVTNIEEINHEQYWQYKNKLKNEFRIKP